MCCLRILPRWCRSSFSHLDQSQVILFSMQLFQYVVSNLFNNVYSLLPKLFCQMWHRSDAAWARVGIFYLSVRAGVSVGKTVICMHILVSESCSASMHIQNIFPCLGQKYFIALRLFLCAWYCVSCKLAQFIVSRSSSRFWATEEHRNWTLRMPGHWSLPDFQTNRLY